MSNYDQNQCEFSEERKKWAADFHWVATVYPDDVKKYGLAVAAEAHKALYQIRQAEDACGTHHDREAVDDDLDIAIEDAAEAAFWGNQMLKDVADDRMRLAIELLAQDVANDKRQQNASRVHGFRNMEQGERVLSQLSRLRQIVKSGQTNGEGTGLMAAHLDEMMKRAAKLAVDGNTYIRESAETDQELQLEISRMKAKRKKKKNRRRRR